MISWIIIIIDGQKCIPTGCWYDLEEDLTKYISCRADGRLQVRYYHGNNGCNNREYFLPKLTYKSPKKNPCCIADSNIVLSVCDPLPCDPESNDDCGGGNCHCVQTGEEDWDGTCEEICDLAQQCLDNTYCNKNGAEGPCVCVKPPPQEGEKMGLCGLPQELSTAERYSITIENLSDDGQTVIVYIENPIECSPPVCYPVALGSRYVEQNGGQAVITWDTNWGLNWSGGNENCQVLEGGIIYETSGSNKEVSTGNVENNGILITYTGDGSWHNELQSFSGVNPGQIKAKTSSNFDNDIAKNDCFTIAVTQKDSSSTDISTVFAIDGKPGENYLFTLHPTYYIATQEIEKGTTVDVNIINNPKQVTFGATNNFFCTLDNSNEINCVGE